VNWDADFIAMLDSLEKLFRSHNAPGDDALARAEVVIAGARRLRSDGVEFLAEAAVESVARNPEPIQLGTPDYYR
jgi:hypothetical protein